MVGQIAVAVVDPAGTLVYFEKMDNTQFASAELAIEKARSQRCLSVRLRRFKIFWQPAGKVSAYCGSKGEFRLKVVFRSSRMAIL
jgi:uncharacterized protein GlcG (DUF336 family)